MSYFQEITLDDGVCLDSKGKRDINRTWAASRPQRCPKFRKRISSFLLASAIERSQEARPNETTYGIRGWPFYMAQIRFHGEKVAFITTPLVDISSQ